MVLTKKYLIESKHAADKLGSGDIRVLSTPSMVLFMEMTARECVQPKLPDGYITVGSRVNVRHLNPAPIGEKLSVTARLVKINDRRLGFEVRAEWRSKVIGEGLHERFVVNNERFLAKLVEDMRLSGN